MKPARALRTAGFFNSSYSWYDLWCHGIWRSTTHLENLLEWVVALSLMASALCMLVIVVLMGAGRWQLARRRRARAKRRTALHSDAQDLKRLCSSAEKDRLPRSVPWLEVPSRLLEVPASTTSWHIGQR